MEAQVRALQLLTGAFPSHGKSDLPPPQYASATVGGGALFTAGEKFHSYREPTAWKGLCRLEIILSGRYVGNAHDDH